MNNKFVYALKDLYANQLKIREGSVGIIKDIKSDSYIVEFINITIEVDKSIVKTFDPLKTGDGYEYKVCNVCHRLRPTELFDKNQNGKNNRTVRRPSCKDCRQAIDGKNMTAAEKRKFEDIKPNMVFWECPICHKKTIPGLTSKVVLDHDHETGQGRAWICDSCNTGIGRFKDDIRLIEEAQRYLFRFSSMKKNNQ